MCTPQAAIAGAQTVGNFFIQDKASKDAVKYSEELSEVVGEAAVADAVAKFSSLQTRGVEERRRASQQISSISRQARQAQGSIRSQAGASGVQGSSLDALVRDFEAQELTRIEVVERDLEATEGQLSRQSDAVEAESRARIFNAQGGPVARPSIFAALFQIAGAAAQGYADSTKIDASTGDREP